MDETITVQTSVYFKELSYDLGSIPFQKYQTKHEIVKTILDFLYDNNRTVYKKFVNNYETTKEVDNHIRINILQTSMTREKPEDWLKLIINKQAIIQMYYTNQIPTIENKKSIINSFTFTDIQGYLYQLFPLKIVIKSTEDEEYKIIIHFSQQLSNGLEIVKLVCQIDEKAHKKLYPFIDKGLSVHLIENGSHSWCSHGHNNIIDEKNIYNKKDFHYKITNPENYILIIYPEFPVITATESSLVDFNNKQKKPFLLLLDVDGVINCSKYGLTKPSNEATVYTGYGDVNCKINYNQYVVDAINNWVYKIKNIYWLTYWELNARFRLAPKLGIYDFQVAPFFKNNVHKYPNIEKYNIIWIDDELEQDYNMIKCYEQLSQMTSVLKICPKDGLTQQDIDIVNNYIGC